VRADFVDITINVDRGCQVRRVTSSTELPPDMDVWREARPRPRLRLSSEFHVARRAGRLLAPSPAYMCPSRHRVEAAERIDLVIALTAGPVASSVPT